MKKVERALSPRKVQTATSGTWCDGGGLYLQVKPTEAGDGLNRSWLFRFRLRDGRLRSMGLGATSTISLAEARELARELRQKRLQGIDPLEEKRSAKSAQPTALTFDQAAARYIAGHESNWRSAEHARQWRSTLKTYASPIIGSMTVAAIDTAAVVRVLDPIWKAKPETANRLRTRIEAILDWATTLGLRHGENPARWRGHLKNVFPKVAKAKAVARQAAGRSAHHPALPYAELGAFMADLRKLDSTPARALEFLILTATRRGEVLGASWNEINLEAKMWTVPEERMKGHREHRVPLSDPALAVLEVQRRLCDGELIFGGNVAGQPLSKMTIAGLLKRMGRREITTHGFRSTFKDWSAEQTNFAREISEKALAHRVGNDTEEAYQRGDLLEKRRKLMDAWAAFAGKPAQNGKVFTLHAKQGAA
jgi:integrase